MGFGLTDWVVYTLWAVFGLMIIDFLIASFKTFAKGDFSLSFMHAYLKDILYLVVPLYILETLSPIDPTGWILQVFYLILGISVVFKYLSDIFKKF